MVQLILRYRFLSLFMILIFFCLYKAVSTQCGWPDRTDIVFAVIIASTLLIIGNNKNLLALVISLIGSIQIILILLQFYYDTEMLELLRLLIVIIFFVVMTYFCLYFTLQDKTISATTLFGSLSVYLFIGLVFAYIYLFIETVTPMSFSGLNIQQETHAIYFSFITLTTVGYGEIVPLKPIAQTIVWIESFSGQSYLAVIIGQLVGRYIADQLKIKG